MRLAYYAPCSTRGRARLRRWVKFSSVLNEFALSYHLLWYVLMAWSVIGKLQAKAIDTGRVDIVSLVMGLFVQDKASIL